MSETESTTAMLQHIANLERELNAYKSAATVAGIEVVVPSPGKENYAVSESTVEILRKRYLFNDGSPATEWEPIDVYDPRAHAGLISDNPHKDSLGKYVGDGRSAYLYEYGAATYRLPKSGVDAEFADMATDPEYQKEAVEMAEGNVGAERQPDDLCECRCHENGEPYCDECLHTDHMAGEGKHHQQSPVSPARTDEHDSLVNGNLIHVWHDVSTGLHCAEFLHMVTSGRTEEEAVASLQSCVYIQAVMFAGKIALQDGEMKPVPPAEPAASVPDGQREALTSSSGAGQSDMRQEGERDWWGSNRLKYQAQVTDSRPASGSSGAGQPPAGQSDPAQSDAPVAGSGPLEWNREALDAEDFFDMATKEQHATWTLEGRGIDWFKFADAYAEHQIAALQQDNSRLAAERWKEVCSLEVFSELKHGKFRHVLTMLQNQIISVGKAAQSIAEIAHGVTPRLPEYDGPGPDETALDLALEKLEAAESRAEKAEDERDEARFKAGLPLICNVCGKRTPVSFNQCQPCKEKRDAAEARVAAQAEQIRVAREALETIAGFAPGNGDVCEIIAKRARRALSAISAPTPAEVQRKPHELSDMLLSIPGVSGVGMPNGKLTVYLTADDFGVREKCKAVWPSIQFKLSGEFTSYTTAVQPVTEPPAGTKKEGE